MDFGATIRRARESRGITTSQLAAQTRILVQTIDDMEHNKFSRIPAPIYGRGFVKLICECLDLDPVTMIPAFMSAFNGEPQIDDEPVLAGDGIRYAKPFEAPVQKPAQPPQETTATEQGTLFDAPAAPEPATPTASAEPSAAEPAATEAEPAEAPAQPLSAATPQPEPPKGSFDNSLKGLELFDPSASISEPHVSEPPVQQAQENPLARFSKPTGNDDFSRFKQPTAEDDFSRFATPLPEDDTPQLSPLEKFRAGFSSVSSGVIGHVRQVRRPAFRIGILAAGALLVFGLCIWGIVALFRATSGNGCAETPSAEIAKTEPSTAPEPAKAASEAPEKNDVGESEQEKAAGPIRATVPLKLPGFYID